MTSEELKSIIHVLGDIKGCLHSDRPADDYITKWVESNPDVVNGEVAIREVYALELEKAENLLNSLISFAITDLERCISTLENLKERTKFYPVIFSEYSEDYIEDLMKIEIAVFDKLISFLKNLE